MKHIPVLSFFEL